MLKYAKSGDGGADQTGTLYSRKSLGGVVILVGLAEDRHVTVLLKRGILSKPSNMTCLTSLIRSTGYTAGL